LPQKRLLKSSKTFEVKFQIDEKKTGEKCLFKAKKNTLIAQKKNTQKKVTYSSEYKYKRAH